MAKWTYLREPDGRIIQTDMPYYWTTAEKLTEKEGKRLYREQVAAKLREYFRPGDTAYTCLKHVSSSGMSRHISVIGTYEETRKDHEGKEVTQCVPVDLSPLVAALLDYRLAKDGALVVGGCGMDMGFHVVYAMSRMMFPNGTEKPHGRRNGEPDTDGGYAIRQRWL